MSNTSTRDLDLSTTEGNVLLLGSSMNGEDEDACHAHLRGSTAEVPNVLWVVLNQGPNQRLDRWRERYPSEQPQRIGFVHWGSEMAIDRLSEEVPQATDLIVTSVPSPGNLTQLGVGISNILGDWEEVETRTVLCFRSITALLQYVDVQAAYQFLNAVSRQVEATGATAHYHLDPAAHDRQTVRTLGSLFDATVTTTPQDPRPGPD